MCKRYIHQLPLAHPQPRTWPATQACALTEKGTGGLSVCGTKPSPLRHTSEGCTIS